MCLCVCFCSISANLSTYTSPHIDVNEVCMLLRPPTCGILPKHLPLVLRPGSEKGVGGGERGKKGGVLLLAHSCISVGWGMCRGGEVGLKRINIILSQTCSESALNSTFKASDMGRDHYRTKMHKALGRIWSSFWIKCCEKTWQTQIKHRASKCLKRLTSHAGV